MEVEEIEERLRQINNELRSLDVATEESDDVNIHMIALEEYNLVTERNKLINLLDSFFDNMIGL